MKLVADSTDEGAMGVGNVERSEEATRSDFCAYAQPEYPAWFQTLSVTSQ